METRPLWYVAIIVCGLAGFFVARHIQNTKRRAEKLTCPIGFECDAVVKSKYAKFLGVPVENVGLLYYACIAVGYALFLVVPALAQLFPLFSLAALAASAAAFLFSLYLTGVQLFALRQWCSWCLVSATLCVVIFAAALTLALG